MNSSHQREQLPALLCDALDEAERARVESHLAQCAQCARELHQLQAMQSTLATLPIAGAPASIRAGVRAALRENNGQASALSVLSKGDAQTERPTNTLGQNKSPRFRALPFALPMRSLAWGGAVAVGAVGLILLARPTLQGGDLAPAPSSETRIESDAPNATASSADAATNAVAAEDINGAVAEKPATSNPKSGAARPDAKPDAATSGPTASNPTTSDSFAERALPAPGVAAPDLSAQLPPLPPPPPRRRTPRSESLPSIPPLKPLPSFELFPPAPSKRPPQSRMPQENNGRSATPKILAPKSPSALAPSNQAAPPVKSAPKTKVANEPKAPPKLKSAPESKLALPDARARQAAPPAPATASEAEKSRAGSADAFGAGAGTAMSRSGKVKSAPRVQQPARSAPPVATVKSGEANEAESQSGFAASDAIAQPPSNASRAGRVAQAPPARTRVGNSAGGAADADAWTGGRVNASLARGTDANAKSRSVVLTLGVDKAIGYARLLLILPDGERQVWRGSLNALPIKIALSDDAVRGLKLRSGQEIRARLEQTDGFGNPKGDASFVLIWP